MKIDIGKFHITIKKSFAKKEYFHLILLGFSFGRNGLGIFFLGLVFTIAKID